MYQPSDFLVRDASMFPNRLAVVAQGVELSYARLATLACDMAKALRKNGISRGDRVACLLGNNVAFMVLFQALMRLGAVAVPLNKRLMPDEIAYMMSFVDARALFFDSDMEDTVHDAMRLCDFSGMLVACGSEAITFATPWDAFKNSACDDGEEGLDGFASRDDEAYILFTSGTTGRPKAVVRTAEMISMLATVQVIEGHSYDDTPDVLYTQAPLYHMGGFLIMLKTCAAGSTLVLETHFDPDTLFGLVEKYSINQLYMIPPALFARMSTAEARAERVFPSVREAQCAGGRMRECDKEAIFSLFPNARVRISFGSSETGMICTSHLTREQLTARPELGLSVGQINSFVMIKLVDGQGKPVPVGEPGQALVKSPMVFSCYLGMPELTEQAFEADGFFHMGDIMRVDEEGYYTFVDRISDMIKTGGENVFASEVERVIMQFPAVLDCSVIGIDDNHYGEAIGAAIVLKPDASASFSAQALTQFCKEHMPSFKKPRYLAILDEIPRNSLGKVQKNELRARQDEFDPIVL